MTKINTHPSKTLKEAQLAAGKARGEFLKNFSADPWQGYPTLEAALEDYKCTTAAEALARMLNRESVFLSGPAGSGKTTLIKKFIQLIEAEYEGFFDIALTATTGIAATLIQGQTIHSWAGLGVSTEPFNRNEIPLQMVRKASNMRHVDVLIIDEISMMPAHLFEKLDLAMRHFRRKPDLPFGGVQLILMGDFLQLPPVDRREEGVNANFVAYTDVWKELDLSYCYMDKSHRATDHRLQEVLTKMANNKVDVHVRELIESRRSAHDHVVKKANRVYTTLFTTNQNVDKFNLEQQAANNGQSRVFKATSGGQQRFIEKITQEQGIPEESLFKIGDTVIVTANMETNTGTYLANGSVGRIEAFWKSPLDPTKTIPYIRFNDGKGEAVEFKRYAYTQKETVVNQLTGKPQVIDKEVAWVKQLPLKLGYAITVHRSQGQTYDGVVADLSRCFTPGLGYVALSRVRELDDLIITGFSESAFAVDPKSFNLSRWVKRKAWAGRKEFVDNQEEYSQLLQFDLARGLLWNVENTHRYKEFKKLGI